MFAYDSAQRAMILEALSLALLATAPAVYFEQTVVTTSDGRRGGGAVASRVWFAGKKMRMEPADASGAAFVLRLDSGRAFRLDPAEQTAVAIDLARLRTRSRNDVAMASDLMGADAGPAKVAPLSEKRQLAGHPCRGYRITSGTTMLDVYLAEDLPVGIEAFADFLEWSGASESMAPFLAPLRKLRGFPLETHASVSVLGHVQETRSTVTKVLVGPLAESLFEPPPGWSVVSEETDEEP